MKTKFCFLDMDGVLADFNGGILKVHGKENPYNPNEKGLWNIGDYWNISNDEMMKPTHQPGFWENLEVIPGSFEMVETLADIFGIDNICILSSPAKNSAICIPEKIKWLQKYFPEIAERKNYFFGSKKGFMGAEGNWLVDDGDFNIEDFEAAGGNGLLFPQPWNNRFESHYRLDTKNKFFCSIFQELSMYFFCGKFNEKVVLDK